MSFLVAEGKRQRGKEVFLPPQPSVDSSWCLGCCAGRDTTGGGWGVRMPGVVRAWLLLQTQGASPRREGRMRGRQSPEPPKLSPFTSHPAAWLE